MLKSSLRSRRKNVERRINRIVLVGALLLVPAYIIYQAVRLTGGLAGNVEESIVELPDLVSRIQEPVVWEVDKVTNFHFFHAPPDSGNKFVLVDLRMQARLKLGYEIIPKCFQLIDNRDIHYYPLSRSPLFIERGVSFKLDKDESLGGGLLFEIPRAHKSVRLIFDRYQE
tara:strand:- start:2841 stop:3350 length:510 start_codon:yes stop_codon:yes gene_type:complete